MFVKKQLNLQSTKQLNCPDRLYFYIPQPLSQVGRNKHNCHNWGKAFFSTKKYAYLSGVFKERKWLCSVGIAEQSNNNF